MGIIRNLARRRLRTGLTILGIGIGIWALVVFGSMANRINAMVGNGGTYFQSGVISVWGGGGDTPKTNPLDIAVTDELRSIAGVDVVVPGVAMNLSDDAPAMSMGLPPMITAQVPGLSAGHDSMVLRAASGRMLTAADEDANVTVLGTDLARDRKSVV
jgi:hypothetical protein